MTTTAAASPPTLQYAVPFREERTEDGTLRLTLVTDRSAAVKTLGGIAAMCILAGLLLIALWFIGGSVKALALGLAFGPLGAMLAGGALVAQMNSAQTKTYVIEVGPAGLVIQNPVGTRFGVHRHVLSEVVGVKSSGMALDVYTTTRGSYSCLAFAGAKRLQAVERLVNQELAYRGCATACAT